MAVGGLLALLDDLSVLMDDVAAMTKVAATKTAGITGDDLAVNAEVLRGLDPKRELPIVWAVTKGSLKNKAILIPSALLLAAFAPWAIMPLLIFGGLFLCFEGVEKILHALQARKSGHAALTEAMKRGADDLLAFEQDKIKSAIRTDLVLSAEIIAIALASVAGQPLVAQVTVLLLIGLGMTAVVYGLVAVLVKLDDIGFYLSQRRHRVQQTIGRGMIAMIPWLMKTISVVGTAAMFTVGGGIIVHGWPWLDRMLQVNLGPLFPQGLSLLLAIIISNAVVGILAGFASLWAVKAIGIMQARLLSR